MKRLFISLLLIILSLALSNCSSRGESYQVYSMNSSGNYKIQITGYREKCLCFNPGTYFVVESIGLKNGSSREIFTIRVDDEIEKPGENVKVENENLAYLWLEGKFAITSDGGKNWSKWDAQKHNDKFNTDYYLIKKVKINKNGKGEMFLTENSSQEILNPKLITKDFGKTWQKP